MTRQIISIPHSNALISYRPADKKKSLISGDDNRAETALVQDNDIMILSGDFRKEARQLIERYDKDSHTELCKFFNVMRMEWGSSWNKGSNFDNWKLFREIGGR